MFHINRNTVPEECKKGEDCKFSKHFESFEEAQKYADSIMAEEFSFIPNVIYSSNVPSDDVVEYLTNNHSELYVATQLLNHDVEPIVIVGQSYDDEAIYHCVFKFNDLYQDINGVIAADRNQLDSYIKSTYNLIDEPYAAIDGKKAISMIESLLKFDLFDENARGRMVKLLELYLIQFKNNKNKIGFESIKYLLKELI